LRFANWLRNGQGLGDTENGAYELLGGTAIPTNGSSVVRDAGATWFLPSENEWYKAAYHKNDGPTGNYWNFPTESDSVPAASPPPGGGAAPGSANYNNAVGTIVQVGSYNSIDNQGDPVSDGPYGTFDQGGNAWEWTEPPIRLSDRVIRGGSWIESSLPLAAAVKGFGNPDEETELVGFRVATVPEPSTTALVSIFGLGCGNYLRRKCALRAGRGKLGLLDHRKT
jgi:sulfatase modifying factor 1